MPQITEIFTFRVDETVQRLVDSLRTVEWAVAQLLNKTVQHTWEHGNAVLRIALFAAR